MGIKLKTDLLFLLEGVAFDFVVQLIKDSVFALSQELVCLSLRSLRPLRFSF
jgi:hypothetical protein